MSFSLTEMVKGWWWIKEPEELTAILSALHPRGIRERVLHKHLTKHIEYLAEVCRRPVTGEEQEHAECDSRLWLMAECLVYFHCSFPDAIFQMKVEEGDVLLEAYKQVWSEQERALKLDISALQWVEDLEQRVVGADLQLKVKENVLSTFKRNFFLLLRESEH